MKMSDIKPGDKVKLVKGKDSGSEAEVVRIEGDVIVIKDKDGKESKRRIVHVDEP